MSYYEKNRDRALAYQKEYNKKNIEKYLTYQGIYYIEKRCDPSYIEKNKRARRAYYIRKHPERVLRQKQRQLLSQQKRREKEIEIEDRRFIRNKKRMLKELLDTVNEIPPVSFNKPKPSKPIKEIIPNIIPFENIKINKIGNFILDW